MSQIVVVPGATFEAWAQFPTGITLYVRIRDGAGGNFLARTSSGITEDIASSGLYRKSFTAPTTAGQYQIVWDDGTTFATEELLVTYSAPTSSATGTAYVTSADVKSSLALQGYTFADTDIARAILAASRAIDWATGRRFYLDTDATSVRYYTPDSPSLLAIDDLVTLTSILVDQDGDGTFEETWTVNTDFVLTPLNAAADSEPYWWVEVRNLSGRRFPCQLERSVKVTGQFGWPSVPSDIQLATSILASKLLRRVREAPFGIVSFGLDQGSAMRIARTDPDVAPVVAHYNRKTFFL